MDDVLHTTHTASSHARVPRTCGLLPWWPRPHVAIVSSTRGGGASPCAGTSSRPPLLPHQTPTLTLTQMDLSDCPALAGTTGLMDRSNCLLSSAAALQRHAACLPRCSSAAMAEEGDEGDELQRCRCLCSAAAAADLQSFSVQRKCQAVIAYGRVQASAGRRGCQCW